MALWEDIAEQISTTTGDVFTPGKAQPIGGGSINDAYVLSDQQRKFFLKLNRLDGLEMFEAEAAGLQALADANVLRVPQIVCTGCAENKSFIVMEYLELSGRGDMTLLGQQLAELHRNTAEHFGWYRDNTIGSTKQINTQDKNWLNFWRQHRLGFQLKLAAHHGYKGTLQSKGERLLSGLDQLIGHRPQASLLHGDLWSGNYAFTNGEPVLFDPAVYYGDREADLAMTELFGGFSPVFYQAYREAWPVDDEYAIRKVVYNLYHILNHLNLFGGGYLYKAESMIDRLLAEIH